jgi:tetratricopeptide (TPR) repeat protein
MRVNALVACMSFHSSNFFPDGDSDRSVSFSIAPTLEDCDRHLAHSDLTDADKHQWWYQKAKIWTQQRQLLRALSCCNDVLEAHPRCVWAIAHRGWIHEQLGYYDLAVSDYTHALSNLHPSSKHDGSQHDGSQHDGSQPQASQDSPLPLVSQQRLWLWLRQGYVHRALKHYADAIESYTAALEIDPTSAIALSGRGTVLALIGKPRDGLRDCRRAAQLAPDDEVVRNSLGIVLMVKGDFQEAIEQFDQALDHAPAYRKAWNNRAIALSRLGRHAEVLDSLSYALEELGDRPEVDNHESWYPSAWALQGATQMKLGHFSEAIESCEQAQRLDPTLYSAAFCKLVSLIGAGRIGARLSKSSSRQQLWHDLTVLFHGLKGRLFILLLIIGLVVLGNTTVFASLPSVLPTLFSVAIIGVVAADLWVNRSRLHFVWQIYVKSGILTYVRAVGILMVTLTTLAIAYPIVPSFMQWGWATAVFGQSGNLIFQPFNLLTSYLIPPDNFLGGHYTTGLLSMALPLELGDWWIRGLLGTAAHATVKLSLSVVFIGCFWLMLILGIPFWARLEERIFRHGANSWRKICIRSVQFGLVHILVGIPILAGFVLIVPGFLFACRYKYVYSLYLKRYRNPIKAQEAGTLASTADHAVYNAILVTFIAGTFALNEMLI